MTQDRLTPCKYYVCFGQCSKRRTAEMNGYYQNCGKYVPRVRERHQNLKKKKLEQAFYECLQFLSVVCNFKWLHNRDHTFFFGNVYIYCVHKLPTIIEFVIGKSTLRSLPILSTE